MNPEKTRSATLWSRTEPTPEQRRKFQDFLEARYGSTTLEWVRDEELKGGFRLQVGEDIYDWSLEGRLRQLQEKLRTLNPGREGIIPLIRETIDAWDPATAPQETGTVLTVGDEIATVSGLQNVRYGEILLFPGGIKGMVQDLRRESVGCVLFGSSREIRAGAAVRRSGKTAGMPVGSGFLGRVVDALGRPIDGKGEIRPEDYRPIEAPAPGILDRQPVDTPMETGLLAVDAMFPIGRGQRELIIGDRQTGKTAIALDTILNQKGKGVLCIYAAIGQKSSSVAQLVGNLARRGAMDYTVVVNAPASAPASLQYIAPYAATALGEHFMYQGRDVLIVYDDLSKHAIAYRALSLLLERSPGREAYPGDVFYLHSRLLERSAPRAEELGGGRERASILADATESVFAAVYLDGGMEAASALIHRVLLDKEREEVVEERRRDYKTQLQELVQRKSDQHISYTMTGESGPDHNKSFTFSVSINGAVAGQGSGRTKKEAEQMAAKQALEALQK